MTSLYQCKFCDSQIEERENQISHINQHIKSLKDYEINKKSKMVSERKKISGMHCPTCNKLLANKYCLERHMENTCGKNSFEVAIKILNNYQDKPLDSTQLDKLNTVYQKLIGSKQHQQNNLKVNSDNVIQNSQNCTINNINNHYVFNLNMVNLGEEDISTLDDESVIEIVDLLGELVPLFIGGESSVLNENNIGKSLLKVHEKVHCNDEHPENQNIYVTNKKTFLPFYVYYENRWTLVNNLKKMEDVICSLVGHLISMIDSLTKNPKITKEKMVWLKKCRKILQDDLHDGDLRIMLGSRKNVNNLAKKLLLISYEHKNTIRKNFRLTHDKEQIKDINEKMKLSLKTKLN